MTGVSMTTATGSDGATTAAAATGAVTGTEAATGSGNTGATSTSTGVNVGSDSQSSDGASNTPWYASLKDEGAKALAETKKWATPDDALKSYSELEKAFGGKLEALAPKTPTEYQFKKPDKLPEGLGYDETFAGNFKTWAHEAKLSNDQAALFHDKYFSFVTDIVTAQTKAAQQAEMQTLVDSEKALTSAWGATDNPQFKVNLEHARRASSKLGLDLKELGAVKNIGGVDKVVNAKVIQALAQVGRGMYAEDTMIGDAATTATNPFSKGSSNPKLAGELVSKDPARAAMWLDQLSPKEREPFRQVRAQLKAKGF